MRFHLTTEELLRHFDGELIPERAAHIDRCSSCQEATVELQGLLYEVQQELRKSVPEESEEFKAASWTRLQEALYPPKPLIAFPLRPAAVYAAAAMLAVATFSGYLAFRTPEVQEPALIVAEAPSMPATEPISEPASVTSIAPEPQPVQRAVAGIVTLQAEAAPAVEPLEASALAAPPRFEMAGLVREARAPTSELVLLPAPFVRAHATSAAVSFLEPKLPAVSEPLQPLPRKITRLPVTAEVAAALVDGYWILTKANVWQEDIRPIWRSGVLSFEGTVENRRTSERLGRAIQRAAGAREVKLNLQARSQAQLISASYSGQTLELSHDRARGGVVRNSLLGHFSDAARRSFRAPEPSVLESELDRYVSDVFRSQSKLLSHVYALSRVLERVDPGLGAQLPADHSKRLREVAKFHLNGIRNEEARIYDRLSEALPRRFWAYRAPKDAASANPDWVEESRSLLEEALELDSTLLALLATPQSTIDASEENFSCGELLGSIRTRVSNLRASF